KKHAHSTGSAKHHLTILENRVSETGIGGEASSGSGDDKGMNSAEVRIGDSIDDQLYEALKKIAPSPALATASIKWALHHFSAIEPMYQRRPTAEERKQQDRQQKDEKERLRIERTLQTFSSLRVRKDNQRSSI